MTTKPYLLEATDKGVYYSKRFTTRLEAEREGIEWIKLYKKINIRMV